MSVRMLRKGNLCVILFPQKIYNRTNTWSRNPTFVCISKGNKITILKWYLHSHVHLSIIHNSKDIDMSHD